MVGCTGRIDKIIGDYRPSFAQQISNTDGRLLVMTYANVGKIMSTLQKRILLSPEDYLEGEKHSDIRHEYVAGHVYAMVGASEPHNLIAGNLFVALHTHLRGSDCRVFMSDMKVRVGEAFYYPDVMVTCDKADDHVYYKIRPVLIVEVASPTTEPRDSLEKCAAYQSLPSLKEYLLVAQDRLEIRIYRRIPEGWELESYFQGDRLRLASVDLDLPVEAVYERVWR
jgi:Uma2 family endonuclease